MVKRRHGETDSDYARDKYEAYMREVPCPACQGARLKPESLSVLIDGRSIAQVSRLSIAECAESVSYTHLGWASARVNPACRSR